MQVFGSISSTRCPAGPPAPLPLQECSRADVHPLQGEITGLQPTGPRGERGDSLSFAVQECSRADVHPLQGEITGL